MGKDCILGYVDSYVQNPRAHPMADLAGALAARGWQFLRVGVEMDNHDYSARAHAVLAGQVPHLADATGLANWCRAVKSPAELARMRRAARIVEAMHRRIAEVARPGLRQHALVAEILRTGVLGAEGHWGDHPAIVPMAPSGMDATAPHLT